MAEDKTLNQPSLQHTQSGTKFPLTLLAVILILMGIASFFIFQPEIKKLVMGQNNLYMLLAGVAIFAFAGLSIFLDLGKMLPYNGLSFENEWLYFYFWFKKMKVKFEDVEEVTFYPTVFSFKPLEERPGWVRIETIFSRYIMFVPRYQSAIVNFERKDIPSSVNKRNIPILTVLSLGLLAFNPIILVVLVALVLLIPGNLSKNGFIPRKSEVLLILSCLAVPLIYFASGPVSTVDRWAYSFKDAKDREAEEEMLHLCENVIEKDHAVILMSCSEFYLYAKNENWRDYQKALKFSSKAIAKTKNKAKQKLYADSLACSYFALGQLDFANKVATQYGLNQRIEDFKAGGVCSPILE